MTEKKSYPRITDNTWATRNKVFRGKMRELICLDIMEDRPGIFRVYLWVDNDRTAMSPEFSDIIKAQKKLKKVLEKITLETEFTKEDKNESHI